MKSANLEGKIIYVNNTQYKLISKIGAGNTIQ